MGNARAGDEERELYEKPDAELEAIADDPERTGGPLVFAEQPDGSLVIHDRQTGERTVIGADELRGGRKGR